MFNRQQQSDVENNAAQVAAISRSQAVIELGMDGTILTANENFLKTMGYTLAEVQSKHHSMFVDPLERDGATYKDFWARLNRGEFQSAEYKRFGKAGREVWIQASYNPIMGRTGKPIKVIEFATDITAQKIRALEAASKIAAIDCAQAVIEFDMNGTIVAANEIFLTMMGYAVGEIVGKHYSMFVDPQERDNDTYRDLWKKLNNGEYKSADFKWFSKGGKKILILATCNPILDERGKPFKIVKFATDVTDRKVRAADAAGQIAAICKSQAVIEFRMDGTIVSANDHLLNAFGYTLTEIVGQHHSMFVAPSEETSPEYVQFWKNLALGQYQVGEYRRIGKGGGEIWIQASYNPILDPDGKPFKVVEYATDITPQAIARQKAERARGLIEAVAASGEEMNASIRKISETMSKSRQTATTAVERVKAADLQAQRLSSAAEAMGGIVYLIGNITGQINLLALNATIESARAGEAGRGFAVVASEVKNLASQAKQATDRIVSEIDTLNEISCDVVSSLSAVKAAIETVNEFVSTTAAAVEEQSVVTNDMSENLLRAAAELS